MEPFELIEDNTHLVANIQEFPYQVGKPRSPIVEEGEGHIVLVDYNSSSGEYSPKHHVYMATIEDEEPKDQYTNELLMDIFTDEEIANAPQDEDKEHKRVWRAKNARRASHGPHLTNPSPQPPRHFCGNRQP